MRAWPLAKARKVYVALLALGWALKRQPGLPKTLARTGWPDFVFAFHDGEEIGPRMLPGSRSTRDLQPTISGHYA